MTRLLAIGLFAIFAFQVAAVAAPEKLSNPALEARAVALQKQFRCLVCQGESLDESNAPLAADLRRLIRERIAAGDTDDDVRHYLVARYGQFILMKPPVEGATYLLWFAPLLAVIIGAGLVTAVAYRARRRLLEEPAEPQT